MPQNVYGRVLNVVDQIGELSSLQCLIEVSLNQMTTTHLSEREVNVISTLLSSYQSLAAIQFERLSLELTNLVKVLREGQE